MRASRLVSLPDYTPIALLRLLTGAGPNNYPHRYGYADPEVKLAADCKRGDDLQEFPITRGKYTGGAVTDTSRVGEHSAFLSPRYSL